MSMVSFALRLVASRLLRGETWAEGNIYNSPIDPIAEWQARAEVGQAKPSIAIYTGDRQVEVVGKATQGRAAKLNLVFDIFLPPSVIVAADGIPGTGPDDPGQPAITLETSNTGGAMVIDLMARQIEAAFRFGPEPWRGIWDILVLKIDEIRSRPLLYEAGKGVQIPCVEITYSLQTVPDPDFGVELLPGWKMLRDAMLADPDYRDAAPLIEALIQSPAGLPGWRIGQAALGMSREAIAALGVTPVDPTERGEAAPLSSVYLTQTGLVADHE